MARRRRHKRKRKPKSAPKSEAARSEAEPKEKAASEGGWRAWLPHLIGAFVLFHIVANTLSMVPNLARGMDRRGWADPRIQHEMRVWSGRFGMEQAEFEEWLYGIAVQYQETRTTLLVPFEPYMRYAGLRQSWLMFNAGTRVSDRFAVQIKRCPVLEASCDWELIYLHADPEHDWRASQIGHPRLRSQIFRWGWPNYRERYERGCRVIAAMAFEDHEDARAAQCAFQRTDLIHPGRPTVGPPEMTRQIVVRRADL